MVFHYFFLMIMIRAIYVLWTKNILAARWSLSLAGRLGGEDTQRRSATFGDAM